MKTLQKSKSEKQKTKKKPIAKPKKQHVSVVQQEIKFARLLSCNEKKTRDRVLKSLKNWLLNCFDTGYEFRESNFMRIWKGLFYAMWMSDKPLIQEELCEKIASILDQFPPDQMKYAIMMVKAGLQVLATEWFGLDQHRMDKFLMLVRRYLRGSFRFLQRCQWSSQSCQMYSDMLSAPDGVLCVKTPPFARNAMSMLLHILDCYLEEIAKVSGGSVPPGRLSQLLQPACRLLCGGGAPGPLAAAARRLLTQLLRQSDAGLRYRHATWAWQKMGCPKGGPEALELVSDGDSDDDEQAGDVSDDDSDDVEKPLDPRAGRVDVELHSLPVPCHELASMLRDMLAGASSKAHKRASICLKRFEQLARDEYPLPVEEPDLEEDDVAVHPDKSANMLYKLEKRLVANSDELALRGLSRKHRKRLLARRRAGLSIVDDVSLHPRSASRTANGDWQVEETEPQKELEDASNKENVNKNKKKRKKADKPPATEAKKQKTDKSQKVKAETSDNEIKIADTKTKEKQNKFNTSKVKKDKSQKQINKEQKKKEKQDSTKNKNGKEMIQQPMNVEHRKTKKPSVVVNTVKSFQKPPGSEKPEKPRPELDTPKKVKFALKNNSMQGTVDYYKSVRSSPNIPFDSNKKPSKTNLKISTPSPINPFFKKKLKSKN